MMTDLVERVARALAQSAAIETDWTCWVPEARAAIEAMREPTEAMIYAAGGVGDPNDWEVEMRKQWDAMITAALGEGGE